MKTFERDYPSSNKFTLGMFIGMTTWSPGEPSGGVSLGFTGLTDGLK